MGIILPEPEPTKAMLIHLCKPGGQREGPYSLEQINAALAARKYTGSDYWAWHRGLSDWVPLYSVAGITERPAEMAATPPPVPASPEIRPPAAESVSAEPKPAASAQESPELQPETTEPAAAPDIVATEEPEKSAESADSEKLASDMPFAALDHSFLLTSGEGPEALRSDVLQLMLQRIIGEDIAVIRPRVPRDVIGRCKILEGQSSTPPVVWKKMAELRPELLQQARDGVYRICARSFHLENGDVVALYLFYNKQKLQPE